MVDTKLSALASAAAPADTDLFYTVQGGVSLKQTALALKSYAGAMSIGETIVGGTSPELLYVGPGSVLAQMANLPTSYLNSGTGASGSTFWRGDGAWGPAVAWVPYTGPPQSFLAQQMTRDGDWTMVANTNTSDRPAPQATGDEVDLLPPWTPAVLNARATYTVVNEWTLSQSGWINQYGVDVLVQNVGATHTVTLKVNGTVKDTFTSVPSTSELYLHDVTPIVVVSGAVIDVTLQVTMIPPNNQMYWYQQPGLFATAPTYTSLAQGSKDGGAMSTTAYGCHLTFIPGTASPDWDIVAFGGSAAGGAPAGGGMSIGNAVIGGTAGSVLFVDSGGNLGQDNANLNWDDSNDILLAGKQLNLLLNGASTRALYAIYNSGGDNWFAGEAGNPASALTGVNNLGFGVGALYNLTSGNNNVCLGHFAGVNLTSGGANVVIGANALANAMISGNCFAIGTSALGAYNDTGSVLGIGAETFYNLTTGTNSIAIGPYAGHSMTSGGTNTFIGNMAGYNITGGNNNVVLGSWQGPSGTISDTIVLSDGTGNPRVDYNYTNADVWSFQYTTNPIGIHVYGVTDGGGPPVNYERAVFDWNITANTLTIGTQAGGTGVLRPIQFVGVPSKTTPIGADHVYIADSASSGTLATALISSLSSGGGGMSIGGAITGGTPGEALLVGSGGVLAQTTDLPVTVLNSGSSATSATFWRGDGTWASTLIAPPYTPLDLGTALRAWYKMDELTGANGDPQSSIADASGNGYGLSQTGTARATLAVAAQNGLNTLHFTSVNSQQYQLALAILSGSAAGSMYMVYKTLTATTGDNILLNWGSSGLSNQWPTGGTFYNDFGSNARYTVGSATAAADVGYRIYSVHSALNDWAFYVDGGTGGPSGGLSPLYASASNTVSWTTGSVFLQCKDSLLNDECWIGEIYFTNAAQSTGERHQNEGYLAWKWGLQGNLDPSHPYKSVAPTATLPGGIGIGDNVAGGTSGSVLYIDALSRLAEDNANFTWDDSNFILKLGHPGTAGAFYLNGVPSHYEVPNSSGNNWFSGNSGNTAVTGSSNFGDGDLALSQLTTGTNNTAMGTFALRNCTTGSENLATGWDAVAGLTTGSQNVGMGTQAIAQAVAVDGNVALGYRALFNVRGTSGSDGSSCVAVGQQALYNLGLVAGSCSNNIGIGNQVVGPQLGNGNVIIGHIAGGTNLTSASFNTFIGYNSGNNLTGSCANNLLLGGWLGPSASISNVIALSSGPPIGRVLMQDWNYIKPNVWSFQYNTSNAVGLHVYNTLDNVDAPANWERMCLDWNLTANVARLASQAAGTGVVRLIAIDGFQKAGAPAATDLPAGTMALINDTSGGQTWLAYNAAGTIRKVQLT